MSRILFTLLVAFGMIAAPLSAHEGHTHKVLGTVSMIHENHVEVKDVKGKTIALTVNDKTKIWRGKSPLGIAEVKVGERVSVTYQEVKDKAGKSSMIVKTIQVGATPTAAKSGTGH